jgi:hypothetical protein
MDDFSKYERMKDQGILPKEVAASARADGTDEITLVRLLRKVFGLSLRAAKEAMTAEDAFEKKQDVRPGAVVYWEGWTTEDGFYLMEARVRSIRGGLAELEGHKKFRVTPTGLEEVAVSGSPFPSLRVSYLEQPLLERFGELLQFVNDLASPQPPPGRMGEKQAV